MSRKYLNDKYCVRCGRKNATPYLRKNISLLEDGRSKLVVVDVGCGNGRNSEYMKERGHTVTSLDMVPDYGHKMVLGTDLIPKKDKGTDIILCNYLLMFLNKKERTQLIKEFKRIALKNCIIMVELYPAKDCYAKTKEEMIEMQAEIFNPLKWQKIRYSQGRFIAQNG